jgi:hypothetical protein
VKDTARKSSIAAEIRSASGTSPPARRASHPLPTVVLSTVSSRTGINTLSSTPRSHADESALLAVEVQGKLVAVFAKVRRRDDGHAIAGFGGYRPGVIIARGCLSDQSEGQAEPFHGERLDVDAVIRRRSTVRFRQAAQERGSGQCKRW